jgi:hypothetical protein
MPWKLFGDGNPTEPYQFFLARRRGEHPGRGGRCCPVIVQMIDGKLYTSDNELDPLVFSHKDDQWQPCDDPMQCDLEWHPIPEGSA